MNATKTFSLIFTILFIWGCERKQAAKQVTSTLTADSLLAANKTSTLQQKDTLKINNQPLTLTQRVNILQTAYRKYASDKTADTVKYQQQFFNAFPDNFEEFEAIYGYNEILDVESPLHKDLIFVGHIDTLFNNLRSINKNVYYKKLINLSAEAKWDADNGTFLQKGLRQHVYADVPLTTSILAKYKDEDVRNFWYFFFDEPHPSPELPPILKSINDRRILRFMEQSYQQVLEDSKEE